MFQAALRPQALKCSVARTLQASEEARVTAAAKLFPGIKRLSERVLVQGLGSRVWDADGNELIDFASGIGVTSTGHCHPRVVEAVREQAGLASHLQMSVTHHDRALQLIERLEPYALGLDRFFFATSGAEAVEGALRLARQATGRAGVIAFRGGYHGRTAGTLAITTSGIGYRGGNAGPLPYGAFFAPYPGLGGDEAYCRGQLDLLVKQQVAPSEVAAVILEPVLGEGGFVPAPHSFLKHLREWCDAHGALLIADEVQSGAGRTGAFYACDAAGVQPDILTTAKGLASGYPLSAVISRADIADKQPPGCMGGTYGGNAVACAAAIATLDVFEEENVLENVRKQGKRATSTLNTLKAECPAVVDVRGPGLMLGVEFDRSLTGFAGQVSKECEERGLLALTAGVHEACRLIPPLIVSEADLDEGLSIFADAVKTIADRHGVASAADGPRPHTTGRPAVLRGLTTGSSFDGA